MSDKLRGHPLTLGIRPGPPVMSGKWWWALGPFAPTVYQHGYDNGATTLLGLFPDDHMRLAVADLQRRG